MLTDAMKSDLVSGLTGIFSDRIVEIILYGSAARHENTPESDIDIAIIMRQAMEEADREKFIQWSAEMDLHYDCVISIIDILEENMEKWGAILPFYRNVKREGIVLWKAA